MSEVHKKFLKDLFNRNINFNRGNFKIITEDIKNNLMNVLVEDQYGICSMSKYSLLRGAAPSLKSALNKDEYLKNMFNEVHNFKYNYLNTKYISFKTKVEIGCQIHKEFYQTPSDHLQGKGCNKCGNSAAGKINTFTTDEFIIKAIAVHGDRYDYSLVNYFNCYKKIKIICKEHGVFEQSPNHHLNGSGCSSCKCPGNYFTKENWIKLKPKRKGILYLVKIYNEKETFLKIGITSSTVKDRLKILKYNNYNYEILYQVQDKNKGFIWDNEVKLKKEYKENRYFPENIFGGQSECINIDQLYKLYNNFKEIDKLTIF